MKRKKDPKIFLERIDIPKLKKQILGLLEKFQIIEGNPNGQENEI